MLTMLSIIIASDGEEQAAVATLSALVPGAAAGLIREVLLVDRAANDSIARVADVAGCAYLASSGSQGEALTAGAAKARAPWLMFLFAGTVLDPTWIEETTQFMQTVATANRPRAATFRYARSPYADPNWRDRLRAVARLVGYPSPKQGLLIAREHFDRLGGYPPGTRDPERRLMRKLGRSLRLLRSRIVIN